MKKLLVTLAVLFGSTVLVSRADVASAANLGNVAASGTIGSLATLNPTVINGAVGDTFSLQNVIAGAGAKEDVRIGSDGGDTGLVSVGGADCTSLNVCQALSNQQQVNVTIKQLGTVTVVGVTSGVKVVLTIGAGGGGGAAGGGGGPATVVKGSFDPNGGECVFDGQKKTSTHDFFFVGFLYAPGAAECARPGYVFADWMIKGSSPSVSAGLPVLVHEPDKVMRHFVAQSGNYVAKWSPAVTFNMAGGTCTILGESRSGTYSVAVDSQGQTTPGTFLRVPPPEACSRVGYEFAGWIGDGARANFGEILFASSIVTARWQPTIVITQSGRDGRGVSVAGFAPGFGEGSELTVWVKFPGVSTYTRSSTTLRVGVDGSFSWSRETKKKVSVYFTNSDASVKSNVVTIPGL